MVQLDLPPALRLLVVGAHSDDIEIGCGGTLLKLAQHHALTVLWVVFSADGARVREARQSAQLFLKGAAQSKVIVKRFKGSYFPSQEARIKAVFEGLKRFQPDVVFTHYRDDRHQDHRVLSNLAWNTFRHHLILEYEIPKYDGDLGAPNLFIPLDKSLAQKKARYLCDAFQTQSNRHWFTPDTFLGLMRLRGMECASTYAEAFYCRKIAVR